VRHAGHDYDTENREAIAAMKEMLETVSGLDLGAEEFADEDALLHEASRRFAESEEQKVEQRASRKPNTAQRRQERERAEASRSLREVYRKLAAALHPDRADGEVDRVRRNELMQRANRAYGANDLLALQLEIEQVDAAHLARATAERVRQYNLLLGDQLREIHAEIDARRFALCIDCGLDPDHPPRLEQLGSVLEGLVRECRAGLVQAQRDLAQLDDPVTAKLFLRRRWREVDDQMPF
jgi:F0F1-type ATP synthase membrane subunit b/b'